jgi:hypothetical protein
LTAWLSVLIPLLLMFFALAMERVEFRLDESAVRSGLTGELQALTSPTAVEDVIDAHDLIS